MVINPLRPRLKGQIRILLFNRTKTAQVIASPRSLKKNCSVLRSPSEKIREIQGNGFPNNNRSCSIVLDSSKDSQISALKERRQSLIERERSLPAIGRSMTGGGEGPSTAEVATSFPARLLGAIEKTMKVLKLLNKKERRRRKSQSSLKISSKEVCSF